MKLLPCPRCGTAKGPAGLPIAIGRLTSSPLRYPCRGCGHTRSLTTLEWNQLSETGPEAQAAEVGEKGLPPFQRRAKEASSILSPTALKIIQ